MMRLVRIIQSESFSEQTIVDVDETRLSEAQVDKLIAAFTEPPPIPEEEIPGEIKH